MGTAPTQAELTDRMVIQGRKISFTVRDVPQDALRFFPGNPRIYSIVCADGKEPTQEEIQARLLEMEHVKELIQDIRRNGGLMEPIMVRESTLEVLEGNSRLAAYRALSKTDAVKWGLIRCHVLPKTVDDSLVFSLLGQIHIKGKKDWVPYEQAGYVYRRHKKQGAELDTLSKEVGLKEKALQHLIDTYQFMVDHGETETSRWSYYDEYLKSAKVDKVRKKHPVLDDLIVKKIKTGKVPKAMDFRDQLPVICTGPAKIVKKFAAGQLEFDEAFEAAEEAGGSNTQLLRLMKFRAWLVKPEAEAALTRAKGQVRDKIVYELHKLDLRIRALRTKLK